MIPEVIILDENNALLPDMERKYHLGPEPSIAHKRIEMRIGDSPDIINYYEAVSKNKLPTNDDLEELAKRADIYLITHSVAIIDKNSLAGISQFGFKLKAKEDIGLQNRALLPDTKFIKRKIGGGFVFNAGVNVSGDLTVPPTKIPTEHPLQFKAGGDVKASLSSNLSINLSLPTLSPLIQTIGKFDSYAEWCVNFSETPLVGDQQFVQLVAVKKGTLTISFQTQVYVTVKTLGVLRSRRQSEWMELNISCPKPSN